MSTEGQGLIPNLHAHLLALGLACTYVGSLYVSKNARLSFSSNSPPTSTPKPPPLNTPTPMNSNLPGTSTPSDSIPSPTPSQSHDTVYDSIARRRVVRFRSHDEIAESAGGTGEDVASDDNGSIQGHNAALSDFGSLSSIGSVSDLDDDDDPWEGFVDDRPVGARAAPSHGRSGHATSATSARGNLPPPGQGDGQTSPTRRKPLVREDAITQAELLGRKPWPRPPEKSHLQTIFENRVRTQVEAQARYNEQMAQDSVVAHSEASSSPRVKVEEIEQMRGMDERWRNDPAVIRARILAVSVATVISCICVTEVVARLEVGFGMGLWNVLPLALRRLGLFSHSYASDSSLLDAVFGLIRSLLPHLITPLLFIGPLCVMYLEEDLPFQRGWRWHGPGGIREKFTSWQGIRNYTIAPITEELTFRSCILAVYGYSDVKRNWMIFGSPLLFGLAHVHHAWDAYNRFGRTRQAAKRALLQTAFQLLYTTLFGAYCAYLFLRTGSIWPPITAHAFCNVMGVPQMGAEMARFPLKKSAIKAAYCVGLGGFILLLSSWTRTEGSLYWDDGNGWKDL